MSHEIFGKRFTAARNEPAWHSIITPIPNGREVSVEEALVICGADFTYDTAPVGYTTPDGDFVQSDNRKVILRSPTDDDPIWRELGVVSNDYAFLQNLELARGLDAIAKATGWKFETIGALQKGATIFMSLRTGQRSVFGDLYDMNLIVSDGKAQQRALTIAVSPVRVVCKNTLEASDIEALASIRIAHDEEVGGEYEFWLELIETLERAQDTAFTELEAMASTSIAEEQAMAIIEKAMPMPGKTKRTKQAEQLMKLPTLNDAKRTMILDRAVPGEERMDAARKQVGQRRLGALELYRRFNAGEEQGVMTGSFVPPKQLAHTPYAVLQAVAELVDWGGIANDSVAAASATFGLGADVKRRAWKAALEVATS